MAKPVRADDKPIKLKLEPGKHAWCACGKSETGAFCDGTHTGSDFRPNVFTLKQAEIVNLCMCKQTKNPPYCDGSHANTSS